MLMIAALTSFTDQFGWAAMTRAATPATCGVAMEVPESTSTPVPVPMPAATMLTPGAVTSGLRALSPKRGP